VTRTYKNTVFQEDDGREKYELEVIRKVVRNLRG
jgi:hypothetical protein